MSKSLVEHLIRRFQATFEGPPEWAWPFVPSIPFVGQKYKPGAGLLVYASAENLTRLTDEPETPEHFREPHAWNRYRARYEDLGRHSDAFFPDVGIQPVTDGGLFAAALFVAVRSGLPSAATPRGFLETIAVSNWCKYPVKSQTNRDYIGNLSMLTESLPFVVGELVELRPAVVLMPNAVWKKAVLRAALCGAAPWSRFIPAPQFNATVVNVHLARHEQEAQRLRRRSRGSQLERWMTQLRRIPPGNAWRYLAYLHLLTVIEEPARKARQPQPQTTHAGHYKPC